MKITEIQIVPIKPSNGLVAFASFVLDDSLYLSSIGIHTRPDGSGYRLTYPTKVVGNRSINVFHPINKFFALEVENKVISEFTKLLSHSKRPPGY